MSHQMQPSYCWNNEEQGTLEDVKATRKQRSRHKLVIGNWNIASLNDKERQLVEEAKRYTLDQG